MIYSNVSWHGTDVEMGVRNQEASTLKVITLTKIGVDSKRF
jgi:hypothetical protein